MLNKHEFLLEINDFFDIIHLLRQKQVKKFKILQTVMNLKTVKSANFISLEQVSSTQQVCKDFHYLIFPYKIFKLIKNSKIFLIDI